MSEPLSSHEIEDVLSSIRRLVSEEMRPLKQPDPPAPQGPEKLLLTPSLRVVPDRPAPVAASAPPVLPVAEPEVFFGEAVPLGASPAGDLYDDAGLDLGGSGLKAVIDSLSVPQPATRDDTDPPQQAALSAPPAEAAQGGLPEVDWMQPGEEDDWPDEGPVPFVAHPRGALRTATDPLARAWADNAEAEVRAELNTGATPVREETPVAPVAVSVAPGAFDQDEAILDEDLLRDIVREMIREELAGTLGERITRNVRKLVRLEVNRALTTREFE
ncbi:hypothetical protein [Pseudogemmobacter humi]|uniref:Uncharacterized protein n=1 Tax=Pseudogemmobacter humi TaxID=2483812 RepID=A0A3P5XK80_9RHOB|nr:hypothetical protein [Pseudogemmobacter humi]VDC32097.1 hypothetical protein XINFAN_03320 [Pseudogemmobacter humi]